MNGTLWFIHACRNLRSGLKGFWIFLTCLTLGIAAIAIIGSLGAAIERGLTEQGQPLLGGDLEFSLVQREVNDKEKSFITSKGSISRIATLRAMATANGQSTLVEIKSVDDAYPLYGAITFENLATKRTVLATASGAYGVAADPLLLGRLGLKIGDRVKIGSADFVVQAAIASEPDRISDGFVLGPRVLMSHEALAATGLVQPGSLVTWRYRLKLLGDASLASAKDLVAEANAAFPDSGWKVRARDDAASGAERFVERLSYFMTLVSIAALAIGGAGIANAVSAFVSRRIETIATLKCLGIASADVYGMFLTEIMLVGLIGNVAGLAAGAMAPVVAGYFLSNLLPLPIASRIEWAPLVFAAVLGVLVTLAFAIVPLSRISRIPGAALFRSHLVETRNSMSWPVIAVAIALLAVAAGVVLLAFENTWVTAIYLGGLVGSFAVLSLLAWLLLKAIGFLPRPSNILFRHALQSLSRPGAASLSIILALGLGLTLFVTLALTDATISRELRAGIPDKAPAFFFLDVRNDELPAFRAAALREEGVTGVGNAPMLRGRIVKLKGQSSAETTPKPGAAWALRGDRGLTYSDVIPQGSTLVRGEWWPADYAGPPLVSLVDEVADGLGLAIGDRITVNVLGRDIEAEIANLRQVNWRSLGINFVMVFSTNTLRAAPHSHIVTVLMTGGDEARFLNTVAAAYPSVTAVRVKDVLATVSDLLGKMLGAVRGANALTLLTGVLVLSGALAAGLSSRSYEAVILKTYGASRRQLLAAFVIEYSLLGFVAAVFGIIVGALGAWYLATFILEMPWVFSLPIAALTALVAMVLTITAGLVVTARALSAKPAGYLRNE